jgi:hypothetical protein
MELEQVGTDEKIIQITLYQDGEILVDKFKTTEEKDICNLIQFLGCYIAKVSILEEFQKRLMAALDKSDIERFYKIIKKMTKLCLKEVEIDKSHEQSGNL